MALGSSVSGVGKQPGYLFVHFCRVGIRKINQSTMTLSNVSFLHSSDTWLRVIKLLVWGGKRISHYSNYIGKVNRRSPTLPKPFQKMFLK